MPFLLYLSQSKLWLQGDGIGLWARSTSILPSPTHKGSRRKLATIGSVCTTHQRSLSSGSLTANTLRKSDKWLCGQGWNLHGLAGIDRGLNEKRKEKGRSRPGAQLSRCQGHPPPHTHTTVRNRQSTVTWRVRKSEPTVPGHFLNKMAFILPQRNWKHSRGHLRLFLVYLSPSGQQ